MIQYFTAHILLAGFSPQIESSLSHEVKKRFQFIHSINYTVHSISKSTARHYIALHKVNNIKYIQFTHIRTHPHTITLNYT